MDEIVTVRRDGEVAVFELATPQNRNALTIRMRETLAGIFANAHADPAIRAIVLAGSGGNFSSGGDMKDPSVDQEPAETRTPRLLRLLHTMIREIGTGPTPVVAAVDGHAAGAGLSMAAACDYVVSGPTGKFCAAFGRVGLFPDAGLIWSLPARIGVVRTRQMVMSCEVVDAQTALRYGLVDEIAPEGQTIARAIEKARDFTRAAPLAVAHMRKVIGLEGMDMEGAFDAELRIQPVLTTSEDYAEARAAFAAKRRPNFVGR